MQNRRNQNFAAALGATLAAGAKRAARPLKRGRWVQPAGQIVRPIDLRTLTGSSRAIVEASGLPFVTRNTRCPCGSWRRFKRCCLELA